MTPLSFRPGLLAAVAATFTLGLAGVASAHPAHDPAAAGGQRAAAQSGYRGLVRASTGPCRGMYETQTAKGNGACTHGPDPAPQDAAPADARRAVGDLQALAGPSTADATTCVGDGTSGNRVQAVYAYTADQPDRSASIVPLVRQWAAAMDEVYNESAKETGGTRRIRFVTEGSPTGACRLSVLVVPMSATGDDSFGQTMTELRNAGHTSIARRYLVWMDSDADHGADICGIGEVYGNHDTPGQDNPNNGGANPGYYGLVSRIDQQCWGIANQSIEAHELGHNLGAVQSTAPHASGFLHCVDEWDIMCYEDGPGVVMETVCSSASHDNRLDCNHDDYFHTNPPAGSYLATHWNIARNNFLLEEGVVHELSSVVSSEDGDTAIEPGESFSFNEQLRNTSSASATGVSATVTSPTSAVTPNPAAHSYPDLPANGTGTNNSPFTATLAGNVPCGTQVPVTMNVTTDQGSKQLDITLPVGAVTDASSSATPNAAIPDASGTGVSSSIVVAGPGNVADINVRLNIDHSYDGDVEVRLRGPDGTTVKVVDDVGDDGDDFTNTTLDDEAAVAVASGAAPFTGSFRPTQALSAFDGKPAAGTWTLTAYDDESGFTGTLSSWTLGRSTATCSTTAPGAADAAAGFSAPAPVKGDFNGDGHADLAIGAPGEDAGAGAVHVLMGSASGLTATGDKHFTQASAGIAGGPEPDDAFGASMAAGDLNGDGRADLAIGAKGEDGGAGAVHVLLGSPSGLVSTGSQFWNQSSAGIVGSGADDDHFGASLAIGNFGGSSHGDLAIGVPGESTAPVSHSGVVQVLPGSASGPTATGSQYWSQSASGVASSPESGDVLGASIAAGDVDGDGRADLAVGAPGENGGAGAVHVLLSSAAGLASTGSKYFAQDSAGVSDTDEEGDHFGAALAIAQFGGSSHADLAIGAPHEDAGAVTDSGLVHVLLGSASGTTATGSQYWNQSTGGIADAPEASDMFGASLAAGDLNDDNRADLAIGVPGEDAGAGAVHSLLAAASGLVSTGSTFWSQSSTGIADGEEADDHFGTTLAIADFGGSDHADLAIGAPDEDLAAATDAGVVHVLPGSAAGPTATGSQLWGQDTSGVLEAAEAGDRFGGGLGR